MRRAAPGASVLRVLGHRVADRRRRGSVGCYGALLVAEPEVHALAPARRPGRDARTNRVEISSPYRLDHLDHPAATLGAVGDVGLGHRPPLGLVSIQQIGTGPASDHRSHLPQPLP